MIVTEVLGNVHDNEAFAKSHRELVTVPVAMLDKRILRVTTDHGREFGIRLRPGAPGLRDGDVLIVEDRNVVAIRVETSDVLVITPRTISEALFTAHSLGNRHLPAQFFGSDSEFDAEVMVCQYDHTVQHFLEQHEVPFAREKRSMTVPFRHAEHSH